MQNGGIKDFFRTTSHSSSELGIGLLNPEEAVIRYKIGELLQYEIGM